MGGATQNVDGFSIELEPLSAKLDSTLPPELQTQQDTCEGCPFTPRRRQKSRLRKLSPSMWAPGTPLPTAPKPRLRPIAGDWSPAASFGPIPISLRRFRQFADRTILEKSRLKAAFLLVKKDRTLRAQSLPPLGHPSGQNRLSTVFLNLSLRHVQNAHGISAENGVQRLFGQSKRRESSKALAGSIWGQSVPNRNLWEKRSSSGK